MAKTACNNIVINTKWDAVDPKDSKIMALETKVQELESGAKTQEQPKTGSHFPQWKTKNVGAVITRDVKVVVVSATWRAWRACVAQA